MPTKSILFNSLPALFIVLLACSGVPEEKTGESPEDNAPGPSTTPVKKQYYINNTNNESLAEISVEADQLIVSMATVDLFGIAKNDGKRKYFDQNDQMRFAVRYKGNDFKLRDQNEELLWKVKIEEDHVKIAHNEEMTDAYRISIPENHRIKVKTDDQVIGAIRVKADDPLTRIKEQYSVRNFGSSFALGVLLIEDIPDEQKFLICAELLKKQK